MINQALDWLRISSRPARREFWKLADRMQSHLPGARVPLVSVRDPRMTDPRNGCGAQTRVISGEPARPTTLLEFGEAELIPVQRRQFFRVLSRGGGPLIEINWMTHKPFAETTARLPVTLPPPERIAGRCVLLGIDWWQGYHHWLSEIVPTLRWLGEDLANWTLLVPEGARKWHFDVLAACGVGREQVRLLRPRRFVIEHLAIFAPAPTHDVWPADAIPWLRSKMMSEEAEGGRARRIYVSRSDATRRRLKNESKLASELERYGFEVVAPGRLSFKEQVRLFASAEAVVGVHGAGLTNIMFCPPGTPVIELQPNTGHKVLCFKGLAAAAHLRHELVWGTAVNALADFHVDANEVLARVEESIGKPR